jgi:hypothetical protein
MVVLYARALWQLLRFHYHVSQSSFADLHSKVGSYPCTPPTSATGSPERICRAIDVLGIWYPTQVLCLQRSAATTCLLRKYGLPARLITGIHTLPFKAHAWVEVGGRVVNDKPYMRDIYAEIDSC